MSKQVELIRNAENELTEIRVDGKAVKKSFTNAYKKAEKLPYFETFSRGGFGRNPFTGLTVELNTIELSIYAFTLSWYRRYEVGGPKFAGAPIQTYDNMRYLFLELNPSAYYDLLD